MYTKEALSDFHERVHRNLQSLLAHCRALTEEELNRRLPGFGYPTARLQLHHGITAEEYWMGVLRGLMLADDTPEEYPTLGSLEAYREQVFAAGEAYLRGASPEELGTARPMATWTPEGTRERALVPGLVFFRTQTHLYHHQGQIVAMCRLLGKPAGGMDFPLE